MREEIKEEILEAVRNDLEFKKELREEIVEEDQESHESMQKQSMSRRNFLKKAGLGAAGIGAVAMIPSASSLDIISETGLRFSEETGREPEFNVDKSGTLEVSQAGTESNPVQNVFAQSVESKSVNNCLTPQASSIQAIQDLIDDTDRRVVNIKLKPGVLYEGDTQLYIDTVDENGDGREVHIDAYGAGVHYTGNKDTAVQIRQGSLGEEVFDGRVKIEYGNWYYGPDKDGDTAVIRVDDVFGAHIMPTNVRGAENGVLCVNNEEWCETVKLGRHLNGGYSGSDAPSLQDPLYYVRAAGGNSSFPDADGTASFRDADIQIRWAEARDGDGTAANGGITFWQDHASFHGGKLDIRGMCPDGGTLYKVDGGSYGATAHIETEWGDEYSTGVDINTDQPPVFINPRAAVSDWGGTDFDYSGSGWPVAYKNNGISKLGGSTWGEGDYVSWGKYGTIQHATTNIHVPENKEFTWDYKWLYLKDDSSNTYASISPEKDHLTWHLSEGGMRLRGNSGWMPLKAEYVTSNGNTGSRNYLGAYAEHPSGTNNGDTWYIDGSGNPSEGFYGQTSSGVKEL